MPLKQESCSECGTSHRVCPECGSRTVTPFEMADPERSPTTSVMQFVWSAQRGESATFTHVCWSCGWDEDWTITVE